jgi:uncharacterized phage protein (TIGR01671 family)
MNREIRFRWWSAADKVMLEWGCLMQTAFNTQSVNAQHLARRIFTPLLYRAFSPVQRDDLMQFTGLKDKTGRDIYEGDIVRVMDTGTQRMAEVRWGKPGAGFFLICERTAWMGHLSGGGKKYDQETCEVIGNVFENPDLLSKVPNP